MLDALIWKLMKSWNNLPFSKIAFTWFTLGGGKKDPPSTLRVKYNATKIIMNKSIAPISGLSNEILCIYAAEGNINLPDVKVWDWKVPKWCMRRSQFTYQIHVGQLCQLVEC